MEGIASSLDRSNSLDESRMMRGNAILSKVESIAQGNSFSDEVEKADGAEKKLSAHDAHKKKQEAKLWDACIQAESIFVGQMLKQMRNTVHKGELLNGGQTEEIFTDMLYDQYAQDMSKTANFGIAKSMYDQMSKML